MWEFSQVKPVKPVPATPERMRAPGPRWTLRARPGIAVDLPSVKNSTTCRPFAEMAFLLSRRGRIDRETPNPSLRPLRGRAANRSACSVRTKTLDSCHTEFVT